MRMAAISVVFASLLWGCAQAAKPGVEATAPDELAANCEQRRDSELQLESCTAAIRSGRWAGKDLAWAYNNRGTAYRRLGQPRKAIEDYDRALAFIPHHADLYNNRGFAWRDLGEHRKAIADYDQAVRLNPKHADAYTNRGDAYNALGDHRQALADYTAAIRANPRYARAYRNRGHLLLELGNARRAITDYDAALRLDPGHADVYHYRGLAYRREGRFERALGDWESAIRLAGPARVKWWQDYLRKKRRYAGPVDGALSPALRAALKACARDPAC